ncbi:MAG TPA: hypothetical protein VMG98_08075 [Verrucomicrobiae bacterium]|nr:hypothetical protein [Verrucomicrobiae bacterium]
MKRWYGVLALCIALTATAARAETLNGTWSIWKNGSEALLELNWSSWSDGGGSHHNSTLHGVDVNALGIANALASAGQDVHFRLNREAGDYAMDGWIGGGKGGGTYVFTPNAAFFDSLRKQGLDVDEPEKQLTFADLDITREYISDMRAAGYTLDVQDLITFRALRIDRAYIDGMRAAGLQNADAREMVSLKALKVDPAYIQMLAGYGYAHLEPQQYVTLKALRIDGDYIKHLADRGFHHLTVQQLVNYKALGIN